MNWKIPFKAYLLMCGSVMLQQTVQEQIDFREGYIISRERDTAFGLINFHDGIKSFEVCEFKRAASGESTTYSPADIFGYGFTKSRKFLSRTAAEKDGGEKLFMEVIAYGRINLLRHRDTFWLEKDG